MSSVVLVMIVRNEARSLSRCLNSMRPWVDRMVIVDTGSADDTVAIAESFGAEVHHMIWPDDFALARNRALDLAKGDWHVVLDADEWLSNGGESLLKLRTMAPDFVGTVTVNSVYVQSGIQACAPTALSRVLPGHVRYVGRIHEQPVHACPLRDLPVVIEHDGYLPAQMDQKSDRNLRLLLRALDEEPDNDYLLYQLGKDHEVHDRFDQAMQAYLRALNLCSGTARHRHDLVLRMLFCLKQLHRLTEALQLAEQELPHWSHSADFHFTLGDVLLSHALTVSAEQAHDLLPMIESCWLRCLELGDTLHLEGAVEGRGSHLAAYNLVVFYDSLGLKEKADPWRSLAKTT